MIRSMTAFARRQVRDVYGELIWEIRSVNHRYLEMTVRLPEELRVIEPGVRERIGQRLGRGKVECNLRFRPGAATRGEIRVSERMVSQLLDTSQQLLGFLHTSSLPTVTDIMRWPGVLETEEQDFTPVQQMALQALDSALDDLVAAREREGARLAELIHQRLEIMREQVARARERMPWVIDSVRERLRARLAEIAGELDPARLEQEMALLAQRLDVDEEVDRLSTHLDEVERVLGSDEPVGRRLDFLMQELNREANTQGSKSVDVETTAISVEMKVLIEQMREQVQNVE